MTNFVTDIKIKVSYNNPNYPVLGFQILFTAAESGLFGGNHSFDATLAEVEDVGNLEFVTVEDAIAHFESAGIAAVLNELNNGFLNQFYTFVAGDVGYFDAGQKEVIDTIKSDIENLGNPAISDVTGLQAALDTKQPLITPETEISNTSDTASVDAPTDAPTNLNPITTLLGTLTGEHNNTNTKLNETAEIVNEHGGIINDHKDKINLILALLKSQGFMED